MNKTRVAIVENEQLVAMSLELTLKGLGFDVVGTADTASDALRIAETSRPDLFLMDIRLRGADDGVEAAKQIRRRWRIPVVFLTAYAGEELVARAQTADPFGYLVKPFDASELNATVVTALRQHQLSSEVFALQSWLASLVTSLNQPIIAIDSQARVRLMNPAAETLTGWLQAESIGRSLEDIYCVSKLEGSPPPQPLLHQVLQSGEHPAKQRLRIRHCKGNETPVEETVSPIQTGGRVIGAVAVFVDISEHLQAEATQAERRQRLEDEVSAAAHALGQSRAELHILAAHLLTSQETERGRVARELHDDIGQRTALLEFQLQKAADLALHAPQRVEPALRALLGELRSLGDAVRQVSHELHPSFIEDLGLEAALRTLVREFEEQGGDVALSIRAVPPDLALNISTALYRIAQEGLRNIRRHAAAAPARLSITCSGRELHLMIEDAGPGFDFNTVRKQAGLGLLSMQERAHWLGGELLLSTAPGDGCRIDVKIPLEPLSLKVDSVRRATPNST